MHKFLVSLPAELEGVDFIVVAPEGGYGPLLFGAARQMLPTLDVVLKRDGARLLVRVVLREDFSLRKTQFSWPDTVGEILDEDAWPTGEFLEVTLSLSITDASDGDSVGSARMRQSKPLVVPSCIIPEKTA